MATSPLEELARQLRGDRRAEDRVLAIELHGMVLGVRSNSLALLDRLERYFSPFVSSQGQPERGILAIERPVADVDLELSDWAREPGKQGRKDAYIDVEGGRVLQKVRTGMVFLQSEDLLLAAGPCLQYDNQVINFINSQFMNRLQQDQWSICHAACLAVDHRCLAIAGFSGGGKSTLMLHLMGQSEASYLTNDRLFLRREGRQVRAAGIAKWPRVNPGTIVNNPVLYPLIPGAERKKLSSLSRDELWQIERKYDVRVDQLFGPERVDTEAELGALLVLNWKRDTNDATEIRRVAIGERLDLLRGAVMKSPGPFYQDQEGRLHRDDAELDPAPYLSVLERIPVFEARGQIDFSRIDINLASSMIQSTRNGE